MNEFVFALGVLLVIITFYDAFATILWVDGSAGPITSRVSTRLWRAFRAVFPGRHKPLSLAGPTILTVTLILWITLVWAGWVIAYTADPNALIYTRGPGTADLSGRIYFVAYTMYTVGNGDFHPNGSFWQIVTSLVAMSGIIMVTISVSYVLSVIPVVSKKRALAGQISDLGSSAEEFLISAWDGESFRGLDTQIESLVSQLGPLSDQHLGYPILHHFNSADPEKAGPPTLAVLDDSLTLLAFGVKEEVRLSPTTLKSARSAVQHFLKVLSAGSIGPADETPPPPDLHRLREAGIPVVSDEEFGRALENLRDRRRLLLGMVRDATYDWPPRHLK